MVKGSKQDKVLEPLAEGVSDKSSSAKARLIEIPDTLSVKQLADLLRVSAIDVIKQLMRNGIMANINQAIDYESAAAVVAGLGYEAHLKPRAGRKPSSLIRDIKKQQLQQGKELAGLKPRPPVVTVMGHVDHGKTRLLDAIRQTNVMDTEAGGITQRIGAYQVEVDGQKITFLDTPGHEAFTAMRARGAQVTDITILVVAADDGVMPQTLEAIDHARAAGVPIVVAINKIDKPEANPELVKQQLADAGLVIEEWGGDTVCVQVSAKEKKGISELLENLLVVAEMEELKADPSRPAVGVVLEAKLDKTKGAVTTVLVHDGTLRVGDIVVVGTIWGRVKAMYNDVGKQVRRAGPASPVEILGLGTVSQAGDALTVVAGERQVRALIETHQAEMQQESSGMPRTVSLTNLFDQVSQGQVKELNVILKTDVQGSIEPIKSSLEQLSTDEVKVRVIRSASGNIAESDVMLAIASKGIIIGFNTQSEPGAQRLADLEGVSIRYYNVIYNLVDDVSKALKGMLEPSKVEVIDGRAEVRAIFSSGKKSKVAGAYISEGKATIGVSVRVQRQGKTVYGSVVSSLRRFKDDVREVTSGLECGVGVKDFNEFEVGDMLEFYRIEETR
ncbi:MAG: translation initiation factor IF-2 [Dehalococcoidia bacterium]|nr:translation initiation factor IF-2 [Dehalococcoidia bacterium]